MGETVTVSARFDYTFEPVTYSCMERSNYLSRSPMKFDGIRKTSRHLLQKVTVEQRSGTGLSRCQTNGSNQLDADAMD